MKTTKFWILKKTKQFDEYENNDKSKEMQVYLTYKIGLRNESTYLTYISWYLTQYSIDVMIITISIFSSHITFCHQFHKY